MIPPSLHTHVQVSPRVAGGAARQRCDSQVFGSLPVCVGGRTAEYLSPITPQEAKRFGLSEEASARLFS